MINLFTVTSRKYMNKLTKIVATIGPSSDSEEMIEKLISLGVNIFRFNFKHNTVEWHNERIERVNTVADRMGIAIGTLIDLQGAEIRINMPVDQIAINKGDLLLFGPESFENKEPGFSMSHPNIIENLTDGQKLVADDGAFIFYVVKKDGKCYLKSDSGGTLGNRKSLNIPGADFPFPVLVDKDFEGLKLAQKNEIDYVALSFVRSAEDLIFVKTEMEKYQFRASLVAKIETKKAIDDLDNIIDNSDAIMVARGDLGVELPIEQVPYYQKLLIKKCIEKGKAVITATQMLQTMMTNPYPTRAEVSDVANACYDQTDAVMLSGETASGQFPFEAVQVMKNTIDFNEPKFFYDIRHKYKILTNEINDVIAEAAYNVYMKLNTQEEHLAGFVVFTHSGKTAELVSRYRPLVPIFTFTPDKSICDRLSLFFGVYSFINDEKPSDEITKDDILRSVSFLQNKELVKKKDRLIIIHGDHWAEGTTSTVKVLTV